MRSRAERGRVVAERALRGTGIVVLGLLLWRATGPAGEPDAVQVAGAELERVLPRWSTGAAPATAHLAFDAAPDATVLAWLAALRRSGSVLTWSGDSLLPLAVMSEPLPDPGGRWQVAVAAPRGGAVTLADAAGEIATVRSPSGGVGVVTSALAGAITARVGSQIARAPVGEPVSPRPVLVLGGGGWEAKFTIAALEEHGWLVHARLALAPGVASVEGTVGQVDTSRYAAVVALDSTAAELAPAVARYVRGGGGLVLAGSSARIPALARLAPGTPGRLEPGSSPTVPDSSPRHALSLLPITRLAAGSVPLERRESLVTAAARREGAGRVVQVGYVDSWRWRMTGSEEAVEAHRAWWSAVVGSVAYAALPRRRAGGDTGGAAPLAELVNVLGPATPRPATPPEPRRRGPPTWSLALVLFTTLLAEWGSRRLRGAR